MIDSHCHFLHRRYQQPEGRAGAESPGQLLANARAAGVTGLIGIATVRAEWQPYLDFANARTGADAGVWLAAGLHPLHAHEEDLDTTALQHFAEINPKVVAIGECGLDYHYVKDTATHALQQRQFRQQLTIARDLGLPVVVHTRDAEADTLAILNEFPGVPFVLHCFTASAAMAEQAVAMGGYISFSGVLTFKNSHELRRVAASLPHHRVLIETDAPYLAPEPERGGRCQPAQVAHVARVLADCWSQSLDETIVQTLQNTQTLFPRISPAA